MTDTYPPDSQYPQAPPTSPWSTAQQDPYAAYQGAYPQQAAPEPGHRPYATPDYQPWTPAQDPYGYQPYATPPQRGMDGFPVAKPSAYWPLSVVGFLFSFLFGGIALYFSSQVGKRWERGDVAAARKASRTAMILSIIGIAVGTVGAIYLVQSGSSSGI